MPVPGGHVPPLNSSSSRVYVSAHHVPFFSLHVPARSLNPKQKTALQKLARTNSHPFHALP